MALGSSSSFLVSSTTKSSLSGTKSAVSAPPPTAHARRSLNESAARSTRACWTASSREQHTKTALCTFETSCSRARLSLLNERRNAEDRHDSTLFALIIVLAICCARDAVPKWRVGDDPLHSILRRVLAAMRSTTSFMVATIA
eukprot:6789457-Prymnesium_polylepis.1